MTDPITHLAEAIYPGSDAETLIRHARETAALTPTMVTDQLVSMLTPSGWSRREIDLSALAEHPLRAKSVDKVLQTDSFVELVRRWHTGETVIYVQPNEFSAVAVFDDHGAVGGSGAAGWREHRLQLSWRRSPGWNRWAMAHRKMLSQDDFAELVEDGLTEIARPAGADLLELAQSIKVTSSAAFQSDRRLANGQVQLNYVEELDGRAGRDGQMTIPASITLLLAPIDGSQPIEVVARFRYRLQGGKLTLGVIIDRLDDVLADAVAGEVDRIRAEFPAVPVAYGTPG